MRFDDYRSIEFERRERVLVVKLNRPEQLNAVDAGLHAELARVFGDVQRDPDSDVVVLTGNGRAFCAGGDLAWMQSAIDRPEEFERTAREAKDIVFSQLDLEKPLIARLNGHAIGLGASLALLSDVIVAHEGVKIGDPHVSVGLVAGDGGALIWPQLCGHAKARKYLLTGDSLSATEAERIGLITEVVPQAGLDEATYGLAARLAAGATRAIRWTKLTTNLPLRQLFHAYFDTGIAYEMLSNATRDHAEAVAAFRDRRPPRFGR
jgi:enoyl-CoA hydratase